MAQGTAVQVEGGPTAPVPPGPEPPPALADPSMPAGRSGEFPGSPGEPPEQVRSELLWRLATRLYRDHDSRASGTECVSCGQPWPCSGRRLAELGLIRAAR